MQAVDSVHDNVVAGKVFAWAVAARPVDTIEPFGAVGTTGATETIGTTGAAEEVGLAGAALLFPPPPPPAAATPTSPAAAATIVTVLIPAVATEVVPALVALAAAPLAVAEPEAL